MILVLLLITLLPFARYPWGPPNAGATVIKYVGMLCLLYAIVHCVRRGRIPALWRVQPARWYLLFTALLFISYYRSDYTGVPLKFNPVVSHLCFLTLLIVISATVDSLRRLHWVLLTTVGSVAFAGLYVLREWQVNRGWATGYRPGYVVGDGNSYGAAVAIVFPIACYMASQKQFPRWERLFSVVCLCLSVAADIAGASRGGMLGMLVAMSVVAWNSRHRVRNISVGLVILAVLNVAYSGSPLQRFLHPRAGDTQATDARVVQWQAGLGMIRDYPLMGVGFGMFKSTMGRYAPPNYDSRYMAHNAFLTVATEMGLTALAAFLGVFVSAYWGLCRIRHLRGVPVQLSRAAIALKAGLCGGCVAICFIPALDLKVLWHLLFLSMHLPELAAAVVRKLERDKQKGQVLAFGG